MNYLYLWVNIGTILIPFLYSFHPRLQFYKLWKAFIPANLITATLFLIWDLIFTDTGVWGFNPEYITGIYLYNLPLEEILFFICIPYSCVFTYHSLNILFKIKWKNKSIKVFLFILIVTLAFTAFLNYNHVYTVSTFLILAFILFVLQFMLKVPWMDKFLFTYLVLLLPFFIVNGILTGVVTKEPVVWYNDDENLGIRLLTIPVEDVFYGMELILLNVAFFEYFKKRFKLI